MVNFYSGVAGNRGGLPRGVVIHNDAGSQNANANFYRNWLPTHPAENGFAHVYIGSDGKYQAESFDNMAWHTANATGNAYYVGWEVCQSMGDEATFLANEQAVFKDVASYMKSIGMKPNRNTVMLHREFFPTACPHRSWDLHGQSVNAVKDYFIQEISKYMGSTPAQSGSEPKKPEASKPVENKNNGRVATMMCLYERPINSKTGKFEDNGDAWTVMFCNGVTTKRIYHPDEMKVIENVYKANNGKAIPFYSQKEWTKNSPWYKRLESVFPIK